MHFDSSWLYREEKTVELESRFTRPISRVTRRVGLRCPRRAERVELKLSGMKVADIRPSKHGWESGRYEAPPTHSYAGSSFVVVASALQGIALEVSKGFARSAPITLDDRFRTCNI
ncbi:hypothetical protein BDW68DRAFT_160448 [Aspergillus falconensis]